MERAGGCVRVLSGKAEGVPQHRKTLTVSLYCSMEADAVWPADRFRSDSGIVNRPARYAMLDVTGSQSCCSWNHDFAPPAHVVAFMDKAMCRWKWSQVLQCKVLWFDGGSMHFSCTIQKPSAPYHCMFFIPCCLHEI